MGRIKVGTASWTDRTLLASGWYPPEASSAQQRLEYYAARFPVVEVDSTYYTPPNERNSELWAQRTPPGFTFNVKAFSLLTGHPTRPAALYRDLRPQTDRKQLYLKDVPAGVVDQVWDRFLSALVPLREAGKLGALLFQFPQWFPIGRDNRRYVLECRERAAAAGMQICVEFRNKTWLSAENRSETLDFLRSYQLPYVCVDMPQGYPSSVPPVAEATSSELAVVRFHGHSDKWTSKDVHERFGYLYDEDELRSWVPKITEVAARTAETHVLLNNCYRNYAQLNAHQLADLLNGLATTG